MDDYINKMWDRVIEENDVVSVETEKGRVYVEDPSAAPDDVQVQEGDQGGYFYETDGSSSSADGDGGGGDDSPVDGGGDEGGEIDHVAAEEALQDEDVPFDYRNDGLVAAVGASDGITTDTFDEMEEAGLTPDSLDTSDGRLDVSFTEEDTTNPEGQDVNMAEAEMAISEHPFDYSDGNIVVQGNYTENIGEDEVEGMREAGFELDTVTSDGRITFSPVGNQ